MTCQCAENIHGTTISNKTQANVAAVVAAPQPTSFFMLITERQFYILQYHQIAGVTMNCEVLGQEARGTGKHLVSIDRGPSQKCRRRQERFWPV